MKDGNGYVQSRGEILLNYIQSMPDESPTASIKPADADKEREALAFLRERKVGASYEQLQLSAIEAKADEVAALLAAGVDPNSPDVSNRPLHRALSACAHQGGENNEIANTVKVLIDAGTDLKARDENKNTALMSAAQYCDAKIVRMLLDAGAEVNPLNGSGITPLGMAIIMNHLDAAELLVARGARFTKEQAEMFASNEDARAKAVVKKATKK